MRITAFRSAIRYFSHDEKHLMRKQLYLTHNPADHQSPTDSHRSAEGNSVPRETQRHKSPLNKGEIK